MGSDLAVVSSHQILRANETSDGDLRADVPFPRGWNRRTSARNPESKRDAREGSLPNQRGSVYPCWVATCAKRRPPRREGRGHPARWTFRSRFSGDGVLLPTMHPSFLPILYLVRGIDPSRSSSRCIPALTTPSSRAAHCTAGNPQSSPPPRGRNGCVGRRLGSCLDPRPREGGSDATRPVDPAQWTSTRPDEGQPEGQWGRGVRG